MATVPSVQVVCSAAPSKLVAATPEDLCRRFVAALAEAARRPVHAATQVRDGLKVELSFRPPGIATANVVRVSAGRPRTPVKYELAVSDRGLRAADVDRLAGDVARGMLAARP